MSNERYGTLPVNEQILVTFIDLDIVQNHRNNVQHCVQRLACRSFYVGIDPVIEQQSTVIVYGACDEHRIVRIEFHQPEQNHKYSTVKLLLFLGNKMLILKEILRGIYKCVQIDVVLPVPDVDQILNGKANNTTRRVKCDGSHSTAAGWVDRTIHVLSKGKCN